jgi:hypothetical protein
MGSFGRLDDYEVDKILASIDVSHSPTSKILIDTRHDIAEALENNFDFVSDLYSKTRHFCNDQYTDPPQNQFGPVATDYSIVPSYIDSTTENAVSLTLIAYHCLFSRHDHLLDEQVYELFSSWHDENIFDTYKLSIGMRCLASERFDNGRRACPKDHHHGAMSARFHLFLKYAIDLFNPIVYSGRVSENIEQLVSEILDLVDEENYDIALSKANKLAPKASSLAEQARVNHLLFIVYSGKGDYGSAVKYGEAVLGSGYLSRRSSFQVLNLIARYYRILGDRESFDEFIDRILDRSFVEWSDSV